LLLVGGGGGGAGYNNIQTVDILGNKYPTGQGGSSGGEVMVIDNYQLQAGVTYNVTIGTGGAGGAGDNDGDDGVSTILKDDLNNILFEAAGGIGSQLYDRDKAIDGLPGASIYPTLYLSSLTSSGGGSASTTDGSVVTQVNPPGTGFSVSYGNAITPYVNANTTAPFTTTYAPGPVTWSYGNYGGSCDAVGSGGGGGGAGGPGTDAYEPAGPLTFHGGNGGSELYVYFTSATIPVTSPTAPLNHGGLGGGSGGLPVVYNFGTSLPGTPGGVNTGTTDPTGISTPGNLGTGCAGGSSASLSNRAGGSGGSGRFIIRFLSY